jgi:hypothetical protein
MVKREGTIRRRSSGRRGAHETPKLGFGGQPSPGRLVLHGAERPQLSLNVDNLFD